MKRTKVLGLAAILVGLALLLVRPVVLEADWLRFLLPGILLLAGGYLILDLSRSSAGR
ncbi:MAG: hypothetical protein ACR2G6_15460 [Gemmatimonadaceae bacterium]